MSPWLHCHIRCPPAENTIIWILRLLKKGILSVIFTNVTNQNILANFAEKSIKLLYTIKSTE